MPTKTVATVLGALTGVVTLSAMLRLISGAYAAGISHLALGFCLVALIPWVGYLAWRARRGRLSSRSGRAVGVLVAAGLGVVWLSTLGSVAALACAFAASVLIWLSDLPVRQPPGEDRFVRIEEMQAEDDVP